MAEVYLGRHITPEGAFGPTVAVKRLLPHLIKDQAVVRMFLNEARITAQIEHPNVVRIIDLGNQNGEPFIAMELLDGRTFAELRERVAEEGKRVPIGITLRVLAEACRGLDAAHRAVDEQGQPLKLVHRDFTPDNIHVGFSGAVKVIDFGVAKTAMWGAGTEPGTLKGKFFYMSPEMILAKPVDHRADVFAAGVMLYEQLCGHRPFTGNTIDEVVMRIAKGNPKPPRAVDPAVPEALEAVCLKALEHHVDKRFQSLHELIEALEAVGGSAQLATTEEVAEYIDKVFPKATDARHQTLRRARAQDPSEPHLPTPAHGSIEAAAQLQWPQQAPIALTTPAPVATRAPAAAVREPTPRRSGVPKAVIAAVAAGLLLGAAGVLFALKGRGSGLSAEQALLQAAATDDAGHRVGVLEHLIEGQGTPEQLQRAGDLLLAVKALPQALELAEAWQKAAPRDARAWVLEGRVTAGLRQGKRAEVALEKAAALAPNSAEPLMAMAELREAQGDAALALEAWSKAAAKPGKPLLARQRQGYWLSQAGRLDEAAPVLAAALKEQFDATSAAELGFVKLRKEEVRGATALLKDTVKKEPTSAAAQYYLGAALYASGDVKGARAAYLEAERLAPDDARAVLGRCELEAKQHLPELAATKQAIAARYPGAEGQSMLARCTAP